MPRERWGAPTMLTSDWAARLAYSTAYYRGLLANPAAAALAFRSDFGLFATELAACSGRVLDLGGGNGLVREFLPHATDYVSLDPDRAWLEAPWQALAPWFPCVAKPPTFVCARAEAIPYRAEVFDVVLLLFSLNHCSDPARAIEEAGRVLRPAGRLILVLEDVEPAWLDIWRGTYRDWRGWPRWRLALEKLKARVWGWPMELDHTRITRRQVARWARANFTVRARAWRASYCLYDLERTRRSSEASGLEAK
jgi:SAM-dependent methyltransferase